MEVQIALFALLCLWLIVWFCILLPARLARARGRSAVFWVLVSLLATPVLAIFLLLILGDAGPRRS